MSALKSELNFKKALSTIAEKGWDYEAGIIEACKDWIADCEWADEDLDLGEMTTMQIFRGVNRHYDGGLIQFLRDGTYI